MKSELLLLLLVSVCGFRWRHDVTAATVQVRLGQAATLRCPLLDAAAPPAAPSTVSWYRKSPGQSPELLMSFRPSGGGADPGKVTHGAGVDPRKVSVASDGSLRLHASARSDAAVYYCGISQGAEPKKNRK